MENIELLLMDDKLKAVAKEIADLLRTKALTVHDVRTVLHCIDSALERCTVFK